jgi:hypothetical protein
MRLAMRLRALEAKLQPEDELPKVLIVFEEGDGVWPTDWASKSMRPLLTPGRR